MVEQLGGVSFLYLDLGAAGTLTVEEKGHARSAAGETAHIGVAAEHAMLFDQNGARL